MYHKLYVFTFHDLLILIFTSTQSQRQDGTAQGYAYM